MEIELTEQEVLLLRMIITRYGNKLERLIEKSDYLEKYAAIKAESLREAVNALHQKITLAELETYYADQWGVDINE